MNNQQCMVRPALINLNPDKLRYYRFIISLYRCNETFNTAEDSLGRTCVSNKVEGVNLKVFNMVKWINESKTFAKHILCECRCGFDTRI